MWGGGGGGVGWGGGGGGGEGGVCISSTSVAVRRIGRVVCVSANDDKNLIKAVCSSLSVGNWIWEARDLHQTGQARGGVSVCSVSPISLQVFLSQYLKDYSC